VKRILALALVAWSVSGQAEITVGVSVSTTGPGTSLGVPVSNTFGILPKTIGTEPVRYILLDDTSDPTAGAKIARRFASEERVDVIIGSSTVPVAIAQAGAANEMRIPLIALCPIPIDPAKQPFAFAVPQPISLMTDAVAEHMRANNVKTVGFIGFADAWGDLTFKSISASSQPSGIKIISNERFARNDTSVSAQMLKVFSGNPDAVFVGGAGTASALPQIAAAERGFRKPLYHTHGVVNRDFIRVGGKSAEGAIAPTGPVVVAEQLPADHPLKEVGMDFLKRYESAYGAASRNAFAAYAYDAVLIIAAALPAAAKRAKPGTPEFRQAMRDAIEGVKEVRGTHAVYSYGPGDHYGVDKRARVLVRVENGDWKLLRQ
jgi:branched-chain amino acid transport system substrate-binding protein